MDGSQLIDEMQRVRQEAFFAAEKGDYTTALFKLRALRILFDTNPDAEQARVRMQWRSIEELIAYYERIARENDPTKGGGKVMGRPLTYQKPTGCDTYTRCDCS